MQQLTTMKRALLATDGSEHARAAASFASAFSWPPGAVISVASVVEVPDPSETAIRHMEGKGFADWRRVLELSHLAARDRAWENVTGAAAMLRSQHPDSVIDEVVRVGEPANELLELARSVDAHLIIAGARGQSALRALLLGSVSEALVVEAPCPVLIVRRPVTDLTTVVVALCTPEDADRLAETCLRLPLPPTTQLVAVSASAPRPVASTGRQPFAEGRLESMLEAWAEGERDLLEEAGQRFVDRIRAEALGRPVKARIVRGELHPSPLEERADVVPALLAEAEALEASCIVIGARKHRGLSARLGLGSVSRKLVRRTPTAVLVVREGPAAAT